MKKLLLAVVCAFAVPSLFAATPGKVGKWETIMTMEMGGTKVQTPPVKSVACVTEADYKDAEKAVPKSTSGDCKVYDYLVDGRTVTWKTKCTGKMASTANGKIVYQDESYKGEVVTDMGRMVMTLKLTGKWLGACDK